MLPCRDPGAQFLSIPWSVTWKKEREGKQNQKKNLFILTHGHAARGSFVSPSLCLIRVTCAGSYRLSHLQHSAKTTLRPPGGLVQISHRQPSGEILERNKDTEQAIWWNMALLWDNLTQGCHRWPEVKGLNKWGVGLKNSGLFPVILKDDYESDACGKIQQEVYFILFYFFSPSNLRASTCRYGRHCCSARYPLDRSPGC